MKLNEMLDLKTAPGYDFNVTDMKDPKTKPTNMEIKFEATFFTSNNDEYAFRAYRAPQYGKYARILALSKRKQKAFSQNLVFDKGTFTKVMVTFLRAYEAYKSTKDGLQTSSYVFVLQPGLAAYATLVVRATRRAFIANKKARLSVYGANLDGPNGATQLFFVNSASIFPLFDGKEFQPEYQMNELYLKLADIEGKTLKPALNLTADSDIVSTGLNFAEGDYVQVKKHLPGVAAYEIGLVTNVDVTGGKVEFVINVLGYGEYFLPNPVVCKSSSVQYANEDIEVLTKSFYDSLAAEKMSDSQWIALGKLLGEEAFEAGKPASPALSITAMSLVSAYSKKDSTKLFSAFSKAWHEKNVAAPVTEVPDSDSDLDTQIQNLQDDIYGVKKLLFVKPQGEAAIGDVFTIDSFKINGDGVVSVIGELEYLVPFEGFKSHDTTIFWPDPISFKLGVQYLSPYEYNKIKAQGKQELEQKPVVAVQVPQSKSELIEMAETSKWLRCIKDDKVNNLLVNDLFKIFTLLKSKDITIEGDVYASPDYSKPTYIGGQLDYNDIDEFNAYMQFIDVSDVADLGVQSAKDAVEADKATKAVEDAPIINSVPPFIRMLVDSGSSKLLKGEFASTVDRWEVCTDQLLDDFNIKNKDLLGKPVLIVHPVNNPEYTVALSGFPIGVYNYLSAKDYALEKEYKQSEFNKAQHPVQNPNAKVAPISDMAMLLSDVEPLDIGPIQIKFDGITLIDVGEKLNEMTKFFGSMSPENIRAIAQKGLASVEKSSEKVATQMVKELRAAEMIVLDHHLTQHQLEAVRAYTGTFYRSVNMVLRGQKPKSDSDYAEKVIEGMDSAYSDRGIRFPASTRVYRGASIYEDDIKLLNEGKTYEMTGYTSTSFTPSTAYAFLSIGGIGGSVGVDAIAASAVGKESKVSFTSKAGNKILFDIDRLDRCLSLYVDSISKNSGERELILNRGVIVKNRKGSQTIAVANDPTAPNNKFYFSKVSVVGDGSDIFENAPIEYKGFLMSLNEAMNNAKQALDNIAVTTFYLQLVNDAADTLALDNA